MMGIFKQMAVLTACSLLAACSGSKEKAPQAVKPPVAVETAAAAPLNLVEAVEVTGSLEPKFWADVKTQIPGLVKQVYVTEWVRVKKGTPLAAIDIAETEALVKRGEAAVESAKAGQKQSQVALNRSEREHARVQKLKDSGLATQQALDDVDGEIFIEGQANILDLPEFADVQKMKDIFRAMEQKSQLLSLLDSCLKAPGVNIFIGSESHMNSMSGMSLITSTYVSGKNTLGVLGVIGPTRMGYGKVIPIVDYTAKMLTRLLNVE